MRTVTNYFIVNLSFADVLVTIICLPASLVVDITETWFFGNTLCKIVPYLQVRFHLWHLLSRQDDMKSWPDLNSLAHKRFMDTSQGPCFYNSYIILHEGETKKMLFFHIPWNVHCVWSLMLFHCDLMPLASLLLSPVFKLYCCIVPNLYQSELQLHRSGGKSTQILYYSGVPIH